MSRARSGAVEALAVATLVMSVLAGCSSRPAGDGTSPTPTATPSAGVASSCQPVERPPIQVASHLVGDAEPPGDFSSNPPTSGWHTSSVPEPGRHDQAVRDAEIVSALEAGIVVLAIHPDELAASDATVDDLVAQFPDRLLVTPYPSPMPSPVALLTWGALQRCDTVDLAAVTTFVLSERVVADEH